MLISRTYRAIFFFFLLLANINCLYSKWKPDLSKVGEFSDFDYFVTREDKKYSFDYSGDNFLVLLDQVNAFYSFEINSQKYKVKEFYPMGKKYIICFRGKTPPVFVQDTQFNELNYQGFFSSFEVDCSKPKNDKFMIILKEKGMIFTFDESSNSLSVLMNKNSVFLDNLFIENNGQSLMFALALESGRTVRFMTVKIENGSSTNEIFKKNISTELVAIPTIGKIALIASDKLVFFFMGDQKIEVKLLSNIFASSPDLSAINIPPTAFDFFQLNEITVSLERINLSPFFLYKMKTKDSSYFGVIKAESAQTIFHSELSEIYEVYPCGTPYKNNGLLCLYNSKIISRTEICPANFENNNCQLCSNKLILDPTKKNNCGSCTQDQIENNDTCFTCESLGLVLIDGKCITPITCYETCETCSGKGDSVNQNCLSCKGGKFLKENGNCVSSCDIGEVVTMGVCLPCSMINKYYLNGSCVETIPEGYFDEGNGILKSCSSNCSKCSSSSSCQECLKTYFLYNSSCLKTCDSKLYADETQKKCINCKDLKKYKLANTNQCIDKLPEGHFIADASYNVVEECDEHCNECENFQTCLKCKSGYILSKGKCITDKTQGLGYLNGQYVLCKDHNKVIARDTEDCIDIPNKSYFYVDSENGIIDFCYKTCSTCFEKGDKSSNKCTTCDSNYHFSYGNECFDVCPEYLGKLGSNCINCKEKGKYKVTDIAECIDLKKEQNYTFLMDKYNYIKLKEEDNDIDLPDKVDELVEKLDKHLGSFYKNNSVSIDKEKYLLEIYDTNNPPEKSNSNSSVSLGKCEEVLKKENNIDLSEGLIIVKIDEKTDSSQITNKLKYEVFAPNLTKLSLKPCENLTNEIKIGVPIKDEAKVNLTKMSALVEEGVDIFNKSDPFFNDICVPYLDDDSAGLPFSQRRNLYVSSSPCGFGCELKSINKTSNKIQCDCTITDASKITSHVATQFKDTILNSNFFVVKCVSRVFDGETLKDNIGSWTFIVLFGCQLLNLLYFSFTTIKPIKLLLFNLLTSNPPKQRGKKVYVKKETRTTLSSGSIIINKDQSGDLVTKKIATYKKMNLIDQTFNVKKTEKEFGSEHFDLQGKVDNSLSRQSDEKIYKSPTSLAKEKKVHYSAEELNVLNYELARKFDKRSFCQLYWEFFKQKQPFLNAFILKEESTLKSIKIAMLFLSISMSFAFNALFFTETIQSKNYESNGQLSFLVTFPKVIFSCVASVMISTILSLISSFYSNYKKLRETKELYLEKDRELRREVSNFINKMKCKLLSFFVILFLLMLFFWYFTSAFCVVFPKYQKLWIEDSLKSFVLTNCFPLAFALGIVIFRYIGIRKNSKCCYYSAKIICIV